MDIQERFIRYTTFDTQSAENTGTVPSTRKQLVFANFLRDEMLAMGLDDVMLDDKGYLYATLPANTDRDVPVIGFISHYDTSPDCSGCGVKARVIHSYDGGDIELRPGVWSTVNKFPELLCHVGEDIIVTDGTTLLGADDKAGIAEIMHAMKYLLEHPEIEHGSVRIAFNPDEEIGMGAHHFDVDAFGCEWAYTVDGGDIGELEYENFNAAGAVVTFTGVSVHPGYAKGKMLNAARVAMEFASMLPDNDIPERTEGYEGFFHLTSVEGCCEKARLSYIIRDHDSERFAERKTLIMQVAERINAKYGEGVCDIVLQDQYYNMLDKLRSLPHIVDIAQQAMSQAGVVPKVQPIRGGTDGAQLSFRGLPCPNLFTGAVNFHGPHEFVSVQVMNKAAQVIVNIIRTTCTAYHR
ncbi:MAG: peptidase T [Prevotellaceae bacterium]|nr:peptidase T [Prevotellaceae bacterium]MDO4932430.1 peptidase T [Prevotellaceae bacterium]